MQLRYQMISNQKRKNYDFDILKFKKLVYGFLFHFPYQLTSGLKTTHVYYSGKYVRTVYLDLKKAFYLVDHKILLLKLKIHHCTQKTY